MNNQNSSNIKNQRQHNNIDMNILDSEEPSNLFELDDSYNSPQHFYA